MYITYVKYGVLTCAVDSNLAGLEVRPHEIVHGWIISANLRVKGGCG